MASSSSLQQTIDNVHEAVFSAGEIPVEKLYGMLNPPGDRTRFNYIIRVLREQKVVREESGVLYYTGPKMSKVVNGRVIDY